jgi:hypothetical protein
MGKKRGETVTSVDVVVMHPDYKNTKNYKKYSNCMFRSCDLRVMSPARFRCAKLLFE